MSEPIYLSTIGVHLKYAVETEAGTRPTSGYIDLKGVKSIPALTAAPDTLETTTLNETEYKTYIPGLKDLGGSLEFTFNLSNEIKQAWDTLVTSYTAGIAANKRTWFFVDVPGLTQGLYFPGVPSPMGLPDMGVNSVAEVSNTITPTGAPTWASKPSST
jgi:hypothetical protein